MFGLSCAGAVQAQAGGSDALQRWREYARAGVTPEYSWAEPETALAPTLLDTFRDDRNALLKNSLAAVGLTGKRLSVDFSDGGAGDTATRSILPRSQIVDFDGSRNAIKNEFIASTYEHALGQAGRFGITAIVARQRFASDGFGQSALSMHDDFAGVRNIDGRAPQETATGHAVRVGYWAPLDHDLAWSVGAQSKVEMDSFKSFRGVYSDAGDFDVPGRVEARLSWAPVSYASLSFGVDRIFYSNVDSFTSAALPTRFLALLGDGGSPEFAWQDLTVYSVEAIVSDALNGRWNLRYTTRQQPMPTSALLNRALDASAADSALQLGYRHAFSRLGELQLNASYAASSYFLGATPYALRDFDRSAQMEFEAVFAVPF